MDEKTEKINVIADEDVAVAEESGPVEERRPRRRAACAGGAAALAAVAASGSSAPAATQGSAAAPAQGSASSGSASQPPQQSPAASQPQAPAHEHSWQPVTENRWVVDKAAWDEKKQTGTVVQAKCGKTFNSVEAWDEHLFRGHDCAYSVVPKYEIVHHDEVGHNESVTTGYKCSCGATK